MDIRSVLLDRLKYREGLILLAAFAGLGLIYLLHKIAVLQGQESFVFRMVWIAGKLWAGGENPYGPKFLTDYLATGSGPPGVWNYPPYWYPIAVAFAQLPLSWAAGLWRAVNLVLLVAATHLTARAFADISNRTYASIFSVGLGFVCFMHATAVTLFNGQTSIIVYFGLSALVFGLLKRRSPWVCLGLVLLALKPQVGIVAFAAIAALPRYRWTILFAGGFCILAMVPNVITGDFRTVLEGFFHNIAEYSGRETANNPFNGIGLRHLLIYAYPEPVSRTALIVVSSAATFAVFYFSTLNDAAKATTARSEIESLALFIAALFFITPLQSYDVVGLVILLMMIWTVPSRGWWVVAVALAICVRAGNLAVASGIMNPESQQFPESLLVSISLFLILSATLVTTLAGLQPDKVRSEK